MSNSQDVFWNPIKDSEKGFDSFQKSICGLSSKHDLSVSGKFWETPPIKGQPQLGMVVTLLILWEENPDACIYGIP